MAARRESPAAHRAAVLREVLLNGQATRKAIATRLGLHQTTVSRIARFLIDTELVQERPWVPGEGTRGPGRPSSALEINPQGGQILGICIAPTVQTVALADISQDLVGTSQFAFEPINDADALIRRVALECRRLIGAHLPDRNRLLGGSLLITAEVDPVLESVQTAPYLGWGHFPVRTRLAELLNLPLSVRRLAPAIGKVEGLFGVARGRNNLLVMLCGMGIGAAVLADGQPVGDQSFPTGSVGTMRVAGADGAFATLDELASGVAVLRSIHRRRSVHGPLSQIDRSLHEAIERDCAGDSRVTVHLRSAGSELGRFIGQQGQFVRSEIVLIAGPLANSPSYMAGVRDTLAEEMELPVPVTASRVTGPEGGWWMSCAAAVYEHLIERPGELLEP